MNFQCLTVEEIQRALKVSKSKKSCGHDEVPMLLLKDVSDNIESYLVTVFNAMLKESFFLDD
jgi:hypothetical protein